MKPITPCFKKGAMIIGNCNFCMKPRPSHSSNYRTVCAAESMQHVVWLVSLYSIVLGCYAGFSCKEQSKRASQLNASFSRCYFKHASLVCGSCGVPWVTFSTRRLWLLWLQHWFCHHQLRRFVELIAGLHLKVVSVHWVVHFLPDKLCYRFFKISGYMGCFPPH